MRVAMLLLSDPLKNLEGALSDTAAVVAEQRGLQPPPQVAAVLEDFESKLAAFQKRLEEFVVEWEAGAAQLRDGDATVELADLINRQVAAADQARQFCGETKGLESELRARLEQFTSGSEGGTREVVVVAVLRSELAKLNARNAELTSAADNTDATRNVRLDALERQARGLQSRLERRQVSVRQLLQFEADERARVEQMEQLSALRQNVQELEEARERLIRDFTAGLDELRRLEDEVVQRRILTAERNRPRQKSSAASRASRRSMANRRRPERRPAAARAGRRRAGQNDCRSAPHPQRPAGGPGDGRRRLCCLIPDPGPQPAAPPKPLGSCAKLRAKRRRELSGTA
jgi:hypothetical protein